MGIDYYKVLGVAKDATDLEIKEAYKGLATVNNPRYTKNETDDARAYNHESKELHIIKEIKALEALQMYHLVAESYDVLTNSLYRQIFDNFGEKGLKEGLPGPEGFIPPYAFHGDPDRTFREFFGSVNPYTELVNTSCGMMDDINNSTDSIRPRDAPVLRDLWLTLEELYSGCVKKVLISKKVIVTETKSVETEVQTKVLTVSIEPGTEEGVKFTFPQEGDQDKHSQPADVIFVVRQLPHEFFERVGKDLIHVAKITLTEALTGTTVAIRSLNKRLFRVGIVHIVEPGYEKIVKGEGFTLIGKPGKRGDLKIRFKVKFPNILTQEQRNVLQKSLADETLKDGQKSIYERPQPVSLFINKDIVCGDTKEKIRPKKMF